jgi:hypothetical protein
MSERENLGAGIYAALSALVVLICLIGAFVLPSSISGSKWLGIVALVGFFVAVPVLMRLAHRSRVRDAVERIGGTIVGMKKLPFWNQPTDSFFLGVRFNVTYLDQLGITHEARCKSGFFQGIEWLHDVVVDCP